MTPYEFETLARIARLKPGSGSYAGARAVLCDGMTQSAAAAAHSTVQPAISRAVRAIRMAHADAIRAARFDAV